MTRRRGKEESWAPPLRPVKSRLEHAVGWFRFFILLAAVTSATLSAGAYVAQRVTGHPTTGRDGSTLASRLVGVVTLVMVILLVAWRIHSERSRRRR